jgi:hypothetical protein
VPPWLILTALLRAVEDPAQDFRLVNVSDIRTHA